ncbi:MAG: hypothetical protein O7C69_05815 [Gammaproteobacteria bacterium]|nr:hypothetical protein [Gammaproteobacteria bacterium]
MSSGRRRWTTDRRFVESCPQSVETVYANSHTEAECWAARLKEAPAKALELLEDELGELQFFSLPSKAAASHKH